MSDSSTQSKAAFIRKINLYRLKGTRNIDNTFDKNDLKHIKKGNTIKLP